VEINKCNYNKNYPLLYAIRNNNIELVQLLINYSIENIIDLKINDEDDQNDSPFLYACFSNNN